MPQGYEYVDPADEAWLDAQLGRSAGELGEAMNGDGLCFATFNDEVLGLFSCKAHAEKAQDLKIQELRDAGIDPLVANPHMSVLFIDPAFYRTVLRSV